MTAIYVDATTLIALGAIGHLDVLDTLDGSLIVLPRIRAEVTSEPARTNLERFIDRPAVTVTPRHPIEKERAMALLEDGERTGDSQLLGAVLAHTAADESVAIVSDDRRIRTVARGLGATVTGTIGVIVTAVEAGRPADDGKAIVRRLDEHGLHMTTELRERADDLIDDAD